MQATLNTHAIHNEIQKRLNRRSEEGFAPEVPTGLNIEISQITPRQMQEFQQFLSWKNSQRNSHSHSHNRRSNKSFRGASRNYNTGKTYTQEQWNSLKARNKHLSDTVDYLMGVVDGTIQAPEITRLSCAQG